MIFLGAGLAILVVMLLLFGGGLSITQNYGFGPGGGIHYNVTGAVLVGPEDVNAVSRYDIDINTSYTKGETTHEAEGKELFNGLLFGSNSLKYELDSNGIEDLVISFRVTRTNNYAPLVIRVGDSIIEKKNYALGEYDVGVDKKLLSDKMTVEISAESSLWRIWAPTLYGLDNIEISEKSYSYQPNEFSFFLKEDEYRTFSEGKIDLSLDESVGGLAIEMNDNPVYSDVVSNYQSIKLTKSELRLGDNTLQLKANINSRFTGKAKLIIFYKTQSEHILEMPFNITESRRNSMDRGTISFDIVDVTKSGGFSVKIMSGSEELFSEYGTAEERSYSYSFGKGNVNAGVNRVVIRSVEGATFSVYDLSVKY